MKRILPPVVIVILLAAFGWWWLSPAQVLKRRVVSLLETLTIDAGSGRAIRHAGAYSLDRLLARKIELSTPTIAEANGTFDRDELVSAYSWLSDNAKETRFELNDIRSLNITGDTAEIKVSLEGLVELAVYRPADGAYDVTFSWQKESDGWRLTRAIWDKQP